MLKIGIIGSTSFIAQSLIEYFQPLNLILRTWSREPGTKDFDAFDFPDKLVDMETLTDLDYIFYLAGEGIQPRSKPNHQLLYGVNTFEPIRIINELNIRNYKGVFISFGSYFEIGRTKLEQTYTEKNVVHTPNLSLNDYCTSKRLFSRFTNDFVRCVHNMSLMHFILPNVYGVGENKERLIPYLVNQIRLGEKIQLSSGTQVRQYLHVRDISLLMKYIVTHRRGDGGIYNLGSPYIISVRELVHKILECGKNNNLKIPEYGFDEVSKRDEGARYLALEDGLANETFNWAPESDLDESINEYYQQ